MEEHPPLLPQDEQVDLVVVRHIVLKVLEMGLVLLVVVLILQVLELDGEIMEEI